MEFRIWLCILVKIAEVSVIKGLVKIFKEISRKHVMIYFYLGYVEWFAWLHEKSQKGHCPFS